MKQKLKEVSIIFAFMLLVLILSNTKALAKEITNETITSDYEGDNVYIIGTHMFTKGYISTQEIMLASKTIEGNTIDDMVIYRKNASGTEWTNAADGSAISVEELPSFEIEYIEEEKLPEEVDLTSTIEGKTNTFVNTYYNKLTDNITTVNEEIYYVSLGTYTGTANPTELTIAEETYDASSKKLSVGNNKFIEVPVWKINNNNEILVALPWLCVDSLPTEKTIVTVGGQNLEVKLYSDSVGELTIAGVGTNRENDMKITSVEGTTVNVVYTHRAAYCGVKLALGDEVITDSNTVIFRKAPNGSVGLTVPEDGFTYTLYPNYANESVTEEATTTKTYKIALPGKGVITINFIFNAVVPEENN